MAGHQKLSVTIIKEDSVTSTGEIVKNQLRHSHEALEANWKVTFVKCMPHELTKKKCCFFF